VLIVDAAPGVPAKVTDVPVTAARALRTVRGSLAELTALEIDPADLLKVVVTEPARAGLREDVRELFPNALEVHVARDAAAAAARPEQTRTDRAPGDLLRDYLRSRDVTDPRVEALFARLHDDVLTGDPRA
jgi:exonuclease SbcD